MERDNVISTFNVHSIEKAIAKKENITIIQTAIIGSRGWSYEDEDSDLDLRFFYVRGLNEYICINHQSDTITYPIDGKEDIQGFDLARALKLICSQNPVIYEIINSPNQCLNNEFVELIKDFSDRVFIPKQMVKKYYYIIKEEIKKLENNKSNNVKTYIFILRMIATINYIKRYGKYPTCSIEFLFNNEANKHLREIVNKLIYLKQNGKKTLSFSEDYIKLFNNELSWINPNDLDDSLLDYSEIEKKANELLYKIVLSIDKDNIFNRISDMDKDKRSEMVV